MNRLYVFAVNSALLVLFAFVAPQLEPADLLVIFVGLQLILIGSHLVVLHFDGLFDPFDALNILNTGLFIHFVFAPVLLTTRTITGFYTDLWNPADAPYAFVLIQLVGLSVQAGYYLPLQLSARAPFSGLQPSAIRIAMLALLVLGVALALQGLRLQAGTFATVDTPIVILTGTTFLLPHILMMAPVGRSAVGLVVTGLGLVTVLAVSVLSGSGSKQGVLNVVLAVVFYRHYFVAPLKIRQLAAVGTLGLVALIYMNYARVGGLTQTLSSAATANPFVDGNWQRLMQAGVASALTPYEGLLVAINTFPNLLPFQGGQRIIEEMLYPLFPRIFFPEKPIVYGSAFVWELYRGFLTLERPIYESISLPGHLYIDFGVAGVVVAGFITGAVQRVIYQMLIARRPSRGSVALYGAIVALTFTAARAFQWTTYTIVTSIVVPTLMVWCVQRPTSAADVATKR